VGTKRLSDEGALRSLKKKRNGVEQKKKSEKKRGKNSEGLCKMGTQQLGEQQKGMDQGDSQAEFKKTETRGTLKEGEERGMISKTTGKARPGRRHHSGIFQKKQGKKKKEP